MACTKSQPSIHVHVRLYAVKMHQDAVKAMFGLGRSNKEKIDSSLAQKFDRNARAKPAIFSRLGECQSERGITLSRMWSIVIDSVIDSHPNNEQSQSDVGWSI